MKFNYCLKSLAVMAIFASCQDDAELLNAPLKGSEVTVTAVREDAPHSRTTMTDERKINWHADDKLSVFLGSNVNQPFTIYDGAGTDYATFKGSGEIFITGGSESSAGAFTNVAYYPYDRNVQIAQGANGVYTITTSLPSNQTYRQGSFGQDTYHMVAVAESNRDYAFKFKNVGSMFKLYLKGSAEITKIELESQANKLAGACTIEAAYGLSDYPKLTLNGELSESNKITLDCTSETGEGVTKGVQLSDTESTVFVISVPPIAGSADDLTFTIYDANYGYMVYKNAAAYSVARNQYYTFGATTAVEYKATAYTKDYEQNGNEYNVFNADGLVYVFNNITPNTVINIKDNLDMTGKTINATNGNVGFTLNGNGFTISNLEGVEQGLFVNNSGSSIYKFYKVKLEGCSVNSTTNYGALFVGDADTCDELVIEGCEVNNCTVSSGKYAAAFVAYTAGYNDPNDGPVYSDITIKDCKVVGGSITGGGSTAAAIGHAGGNPDTDNIVTNLTVSGVAINGEDAAHTGIVVGTANVGKTIITNIVNENVTGNYNPNHPLYGRFVPNSTGKLAIDGVNVVSTANDLYSLATAATGEVKIALANDITLGNETGACDAVNFINATSVTIDGGNKKIIFKGKAQHERDTSIEKVAGILSAGNITVKNVTLVNEKLSYNGTTSSADRIQVYTTIRGNSVTYENVTFDGGVQVKGNETFRGCSFTETVLTADADGYAKDGRFCMFIDHEYDATGTFEVTLDGCTFNASGYGCVKVSGDDGAYITVNVKDCSFTNTCPSNSWSKTTPKFDIKKTGANITVNDQGGNTWSTGNNRGIGEG